MKNSSYTCALLIFLPLFISAVAAGPTTPLVDQTCKKTADYALCVSSLSSDPRTASARDVKTLALIELGTVSAKAKAVEDRVEQLLKSATDPGLLRVYGVCVDAISGIVVNRVPQAVAALKSANYADAKVYAGQVKSDVSLCLTNVANPPFAGDAQLVSRLGGVTVGIIDLLH